MRNLKVFLGFLLMIAFVTCFSLFKNQENESKQLSKTGFDAIQVAGLFENAIARPPHSPWDPTDCDVYCTDETEKTCVLAGTAQFPQMDCWDQIKTEPPS